jgi:guanylate kinase
MRGKLVILSGPSGVGKDTVIAEWQRANPKVQRVVAYTTRQPRAGEVDGVDYHFVNVEQFQRMADNGDFLEHKEVHGNFYATPLKDLERMLDEGKIAILKIDVQGALSVMDVRKDAITIMLLPPSWDELERRIRSRATDSEEAIHKRLKNARDELALSHHYQHELINSRVDLCVAHLESLVH